MFLIGQIALWPACHLPWIEGPLGTQPTRYCCNSHGLTAFPVARYYPSDGLITPNMQPSHGNTEATVVKKSFLNLQLMLSVKKKNFGSISPLIPKLKKHKFKKGKKKIIPLKRYPLPLKRNYNLT